MAVHDWSHVEAGIFHDFHHGWIEEIKRALNSGVLPDEYYALAEQRAAGLGPDVLTLQSDSAEFDQFGPTDVPFSTAGGNGAGVSLAAPPVQLTAETDMEYYRRKQNAVVVRHVTGDRIVAMVEVVSPGNKSSRHAIESFARMAAELFDQGIQLLVLDLHPPGPRDPSGIHGVIWDEITSQPFHLPADKPLTLVAYEVDLSVRAYVHTLAVGETLIDMPLFLWPRAHVLVPLETTYQAAFQAVPRRWRNVISERSN